MIGGVGITIGDDLALPTRAMLIDVCLEPARLARMDSCGYANQPIAIEDSAWTGAGAIISPGVTVGKLGIVAAGSVVTTDVPPFTVVGGNPAKVITTIDRADY